MQALKKANENMFDILLNLSMSKNSEILLREIG